MSTPRRRFSRELKLEAVRRVQETGRTQTQVAEELGVSANTLCRWIKQYRSEKAEPIPGKGCQTSQAALVSRLRREDERLRKERDFLKKLPPTSLRKATPNLVDQFFHTDRVNSIWMSDITYIPTGEGWLYLAAVMDLCTRKIIGWSLKDTLQTEITLKVERANWKKYRTKQQAEEDLNWWIGSW